MLVISLIGNNQKLLYTFRHNVKRDFYSLFLNTYYSLKIRITKSRQSTNDGSLFIVPSVL